MIRIFGFTMIKEIEGVKLLRASHNGPSFSIYFFYSLKL